MNDEPSVWLRNRSRFFEVQTSSQRFLFGPFVEGESVRALVWNGFTDEVVVAHTTLRIVVHVLVYRHEFPVSDDAAFLSGVTLVGVGDGSGQFLTLGALNEGFRMPIGWLAGVDGTRWLGVRVEETGGDNVQGTILLETGW